MKRILVLLIFLASLFIISCNKSNLTTKDTTKEYNEVKEFLNKDETWDSLYTCYVYDYLYLHQHYSDDSISFVKPIIVNIINQKEKDINVLGKIDDGKTILDVTLSNKVYGEMVISEYKITKGEDLRIDFDYLHDNKTYKFYIEFKYWKNS